MTSYDHMKLVLPMIQNLASKHKDSEVEPAMKLTSVYALASIADSLHELASVITAAQNPAGNAIQIDIYTPQ